MSETIEYIDPRFYELTQPNARLERLHTGSLWCEGPVYIADADIVLWSDIPNDRILRWTPTGDVGVFRQPSRHANGHTRDRQGRLISCEHGARQVTRTETDGRVTVLADRYDGGRLNSPNDVIVASDDSIWFTDPPYGILSDYEGHKAESEQAGCFVFRLDPATGDLRVVAEDFVRPNGLAFSPDERVLYVSDTARSHDPEGHHHIRAFDVRDGRLENPRVFAVIEPGVSDGFRIDTDGNIWTSAGDGVHCYDPAGTLLGRIHIPEPVSNLTFGGPRRNRLFITASSSLYAIYVAQTGAQWP
ncbi:SMP-30/gluconolactonase/LRE family protein [Salinisphaera sp.]|uniref:SMP-30/gluconolactonase/LRE family protein n=1 Tax=Salinisphaera sp. TaxID=1914330 RepID=UPI002D77C08F|nr:SMP-30/gluconolactonase/LRE family protein [Salinisphaera sp.]HET7314242.1 SMP-30/gluconolactonase/LRE family protein [Salinisphaera sp.]